MSDHINTNSLPLKVLALDLRLSYAMSHIRSMIAISSLGGLVTLGSKNTIHHKTISDTLIEMGVNPARLDEAFLSATSTQLAEISVETGNATVASAAIVFAHSIADDLIYDLCKLESEFEPQPWIELCHNRKVSFSEICNKDASEITHAVLQDFFSQLKRESLLKKADLLLRALKPNAEHNHLTSRYDRSKLEAIDTTRHECVHESSFTSIKESVVEDIATLEQTVDIFISILCARHGITRLRDKALKGQQAVAGYRRQSAPPA